MTITLYCCFSNFTKKILDWILVKGEAEILSLYRLDFL